MKESNLQLGANGGSAVVAEVQHSSGCDPQAQQHAEVIHQQNRGSPIPHWLHPPGTRAAHTGLDGLVETPQADRGVPEYTTTGH